jgi:hypothetical protein
LVVSFPTPKPKRPPGRRGEIAGDRGIDKEL